MASSRRRERERFSYHDIRDAMVAILEKEHGITAATTAARSARPAI
ncbi:hypothetical protein [Streptomyces sp. NPDC058678]